MVILSHSRKTESCGNTNSLLLPLLNTLIKINPSSPFLANSVKKNYFGSFWLKVRKTNNSALIGNLALLSNLAKTQIYLQKYRLISQINLFQKQVMANKSISSFLQGSRFQGFPAFFSFWWSLISPHNLLHAHGGSWSLVGELAFDLDFLVC